MTTTTTTPFVNTPFGVGVVEVDPGLTEESVYVRFEDGSGRWLEADECTFDAPRPGWYREPETDLIAGYVG